MPEEALAEYLRSHLVTPQHLWADDFNGYFRTRQDALLRRIAGAMGKQPTDDLEEPDEAPVDYELVQADSMAAYPSDVAMSVPIGAAL